MTKYAIIKNGTVINIIEADADFIAATGLEGVEETSVTGPAHIAGIYDGTKFIPPTYVSLDIQANPTAGIPAPSIDTL